MKILRSLVTKIDGIGGSKSVGILMMRSGKMTLIDLQCEIEELCERLKLADFEKLSCEDLLFALEGIVEGDLKVDDVDLMELCGDVKC
jgi:hypothetical protein